MILPCPLEAAQAADFDFSKWFARVVFPRYFLYPFNAMLEDLILPSNVPSVVASALLQILFVHSFSALPISTVRRAFHLSCCLTSFWKVGLRCRNFNPCMAFLVAPLILSLGCSGVVSVRAAFSVEIL